MWAPDAGPAAPCRFVWNTTKEVIASPRDIANEHLRILEKAANDAEEFDPRNPALQQAIDHIAKRCDRQGGANLYLQGLRECDPDKLKRGVDLMKRQVAP